MSERHKYMPFTMRDGSTACSRCYAASDHPVHDTVSGEWVDKPTEPGWWWCRRNCFREVVYIELFNLKEGTFKRMDGDTCHFSGYRWQGPINPKD